MANPFITQADPMQQTMIDPQAQWPLNYKQFTIYLNDKYLNDTANSLNTTANNVTTPQVFAYTSGTVHHYEQVITTN